LHAIQSNLVPVFRIVPAWNADLGKYQVWWIGIASLCMRSRHGKSSPKRGAAHPATERGRYNVGRPPPFTDASADLARCWASTIACGKRPNNQFSLASPPAHCLALGVQVGLGLAAGRPLRVKELHGASERTVSRFTVSNTVDFLGQQYIVLWMPSLSGLLFFSLRQLF
jgi:hypothetical protein